MCRSRDIAAALLTWFLVSALGLQAPGVAQQPPPSGISALTLRVTTQLVLVDAVVKDKKGKHVKGLTVEDFTVLEDGKAQTIAMFAAEGFPATSWSPRPQPASPLSDVYSNRLEDRPVPGPPTILLLDALNTPWSDQAYARRQVLGYLKKQLHPERRFAVFALGDSLKMLQDFTDDPRLLMAAVESFVPQPPRWLPAPPPTANRSEGLAAAHIRRLNAHLQGMFSERAQLALGIRVGKTMDALQSLAGVLAAYPGRKNLIWFSAAFPLYVLPSVEGGGFPTSRAQDLQQLTQILNDARVAVYPVDARGLVGATVLDASRADPGVGYEFGQSIQAMNAELWVTQQSLKFVARQTGGLAFTNRNDLDRAVSLTVDDGSSYYVLGYYRENKSWDGKFHRIEVWTRKRGLEVRHRRGYSATDPAGWEAQSERIREAELRLALSPSTPPATMVLFDARVKPGTTAAGIRISVDIMLDTRTLSPEERGEGRKRYRFGLHLVAFAPDGELAGTKDLSIDTTLTPEGHTESLQGGLPVSTELDVPRGRYTLRVGIRDMRTGLMGTVDVPILME